jgi:hypothetical protein
MVTGCSTIKWKTEVVEKKVPILFCPKPNWDNIDQPSILAIDSITEQSPPGEVVKRYKATVIQLRDYAQRLEFALKQYEYTNEAYDTLKQEFIDQQNDKTNK